MKLDYLQALKRVDEARGAWIMQGQEPLLEQNLLDAFRASWQKQEIERQRHDISNVNDWKNVFNAFNSCHYFRVNWRLKYTAISSLMPAH
jgi:DNA polymerase-3 subunit delta